VLLAPFKGILQRVTSEGYCPCTDLLHEGPQHIVVDPIPEVLPRVEQQRQLRELAVGHTTGGMNESSSFEKPQQSCNTTIS
jgi:hypothetical protein